MADFQVTVATDDGDVWGTTFNNAGDSLSVGSSLKYATFARFLNVTIPQGATILSAYLSFVSKTNTSGTVDTKIYLNDADSASALSDLADYQALALTASVDWTISDAWNMYTWYSSPDISALVQAVVDRPGFASGNAILAVVKTSDDYTENYIRYIYSREATVGWAPKLTITYSTASGDAEAGESDGAIIYGAGEILACEANGSGSSGSNVEDGAIIAPLFVGTEEGAIIYGAGNITAGSAEGAELQAIYINAGSVFVGEQETAQINGAASLLAGNADGAFAYGYANVYGNLIVGEAHGAKIYGGHSLGNIKAGEAEGVILKIDMAVVGKLLAGELSGSKIYGITTSFGSILAGSKEGAILNGDITIIGNIIVGENVGAFIVPAVEIPALAYMLEHRRY